MRARNVRGEGSTTQLSRVSEPASRSGWGAALRLAGLIVPVVLGVTSGASDAQACGCFSSPLPPPMSVEASDYAVNQQSETIIFEVEEEHVVAHVLIQYAGDPASFAWILPVPDVPELELSHEAAFGLLDEATAPSVSVTTENVCPEPNYVCKYHPLPNCRTPGGDGDGDGDAALAGDGDADGFPSAGFGGAGGGGSPVEVLQREVVGNYDTVTFAAGDAAAAVTWLQDEGFVVNDTMAPFMQPYADAGMMFVASKLVPGSGADAIRPLRMRFRADAPMVPLMLTAVGAEPHLTVTSLVFGDAFFEPKDQPLIGIPEEDLATDARGRSNYPMLLNKAVDDVGGDGFYVEYAGAVPQAVVGDPNCCFGGDFCGVADDGQCQCPMDEFDRADCEEAEPELMAGLALLSELREKYPRVTRLTTRLSPEEMTFDPMFVPSTQVDGFGGRILQGSQKSLESCESDVVDLSEYEWSQQIRDCSTIYCGTGACVVTDLGAGCDCDEGSVSRAFRDLDGQTSVTCVPENGPVDLSAGGLDLPSACRDRDCGDGTCVELDGFSGCDCDAGAAAVLMDDGTTRCRPVDEPTAGAGGVDYSDLLDDVRVCAPAPPACGEHGWLVENQGITRPGLACALSLPDPADFEIPEPRTCEDLGLLDPDLPDFPALTGDQAPERGADAGCACRQSPSSGGTPWGLWVSGALLSLVLWRRRRMA